MATDAMAEEAHEEAMAGFSPGVMNEMVWLSELLC